MNQIMEGGYASRFEATGTSVITSAPAQILGVGFYGTATGAIQFFAGVTTSASLTPIISFCATTSAVAGRFSPQYVRVPMVVSGAGLTVKIIGSADPNLIVYWNPLSGT